MTDGDFLEFSGITCEVTNEPISTQKEWPRDSYNTDTL